ncbi:MAG: protein-(glutamine-N5) methyltransferase, release factor-specific [Opitutaceae bacterium BACL24 MAG-120322-bin51]|mgnify:FL=1|jgi:release factor glutamine methyltransferase|nr:MAG: protein-(glutamine-N5) methyltransferase, release factor-specific [Opitutaceae bacterium BACL24 MAG-120322-bin51]
MALLTIREIKERTEAFFKSKGVPNARLNTDTLIAHSLGVKRLDLYLDLDRPLTEAQLAALRPLVKRRAEREPLQYIVGTVDFCDMELKVDRRALIPRYETEELVELVCEALSENPKMILDLGTGSGALALAFAKKYPEASVDAVDLSAEALSLAKENTVAQGLEARVTLHEGSWLCPLGSGEQRYDLIVSNPPYLTEEEMTTAEPEVVAYEPHSALVSGGDGLDDLRLIFKDAAAHLQPGGLLALETGIAQTEALNALCEAGGLKGESLEDLSGRPRFYFARK